MAYAIYTSGSTGKPKGVPNVHEGIVNRLLWMQDMYKLTAKDRVLQKTPFSFDVSVWEFFWPMLTGATLVVARPGGHRDPAYLVNLIAEQGITTLHFVPSMLSIFLEASGLERCRSIRQVFASGEALPYELQQRFFEHLGWSELHNLYGPTEAAVDVTYWACSPKSKLSTVPIGRPIANTQIYILDSKLQPVPIGVAGELHIGGIGLARGYLNRPELTAEKFIADPFAQEPGARLYKTGDLSRFLPDGSIEYLGRIDHQVKIRGFRIELGEIESVLRQHPAIKEAVVVAREDTPGDKRVAAYFVPDNGAAPATAELRAFMREKLPEYMLPSVFVTLKTMPLSGNGKVDRKVLPKPDPADYAPTGTFAAPKDAVESQLVEIWQTLLGVKPIGVKDNYFEL
ncbi:MAG: amino acid adenylation domain-containing protein, partial [Candidatus Sulfotelmatobacter sp.]